MLFNRMWTRQEVTTEVKPGGSQGWHKPQRSIGEQEVNHGCGYKKDFPSRKIFPSLEWIKAGQYVRDRSEFSTGRRPKTLPSVVIHLQAATSTRL